MSIGKFEESGSGKGFPLNSWIKDKSLKKLKKVLKKLKSKEGRLYAAYLILKGYNLEYAHVYSEYLTYRGRVSCMTQIIGRRTNKLKNGR